MNGRALLPVQQRLAIIGVPSGAGACGVGQERTPSAMRSAGLIDHLSRAGFDVTDLGDSEVVPWHPDRANPRAQNIGAIVDMGPIDFQASGRRVVGARPKGDRSRW